MPHPVGGRGNQFGTNISFEQAYKYVGPNGMNFTTDKGENIQATQGLTKDGQTLTIVFMGERSRHGNVCHACWGYRVNCSGARIGQCVEPLDNQLKGK
jgi:hypothetical protein